MITNIDFLRPYLGDLKVDEFAERKIMVISNSAQYQRFVEAVGRTFVRQGYSIKDAKVTGEQNEFSKIEKCFELITNSKITITKSILHTPMEESDLYKITILN